MMNRLAALAGLLALGTAIAVTPGAAGVGAVRVPPPAIDVPRAAGLETAVIAGGCFWGVQAVYAHVDGVRQVVSGYAGGTAATANYEAVGSGRTGHAEAVRIVYDPARVTYGQLLRIFFAVVADPTTRNYQGPDRGPQYRTALFPTTPAQAKVAHGYIAQLGRARLWPRPIVTAVEPYHGFHPAEAYHQDYYFRNPGSSYIRIHDAPKVAALKQLYPAALRSRPLRLTTR